MSNQKFNSSIDQNENNLKSRSKLKKKLEYIIKNYKKKQKLKASRMYKLNLD